MGASALLEFTASGGIVPLMQDVHSADFSLWVEFLYVVLYSYFTALMFSRPNVNAIKKTKYVLPNLLTLEELTMQGGICGVLGFLSSV